MPNLGFDAESATLLEWLKQPGEQVRKGDVIAMIESDKAEVELEALADGVLIEQRAGEGEAVPIGEVIGLIGARDEAQSAPRKVTETRVTPVAQRIAQQHNIDLQQITGTGSGGKVTRDDVARYIDNGTSKGVMALPKVRKAARERDIDLHDLLNAGYSNPIKLADLDDFAQPAESKAMPSDETPTDAELIPQSRLRQTIGRRLAASMREAPHFYVSGEFDLEPALGNLQNATLNDLIQYLTVQTLLQLPQLNAIYKEDQLYQHKAVNLAIAVAVEGGLITPVIPDAQRYSLTGLAEISREVVGRARNNRLQPDDLQAGTFTISNLGVIPQVDEFTAVINPPQVAILAVGRVKQRPLVIDGGLHIRHTVRLTLSGDHRAVDGMDLGRFLQAFQAELDKFAS